jgi:hypothetical protein
VAKKTYIIKDFEGGLDKISDPRDMAENRFEELFNADVSTLGRIRTTGNALSLFSLVNFKGQRVYPNDTFLALENEVDLNSGVGLFSFAHDFNMQGLNVSWDNVDKPSDNWETEFICINDGAEIDIWDSCHNDEGDAMWLQNAITLGNVHSDENGNKASPVYYKADNGLRVCDANFSQLKLVGAMNESIDDSLTAYQSIGSEVQLTVDNNAQNNVSVNEYIKIDSEIMKITNISGAVLTVLRGQFGTQAVPHSNSNADIYKINVPKILTHINRPLLEKAEGASSANTIINRWIEDIQYPEPPGLGALQIWRGSIIGTNSTPELIESSTTYPDVPERVFMAIPESNPSMGQIPVCTLKDETAIVVENSASNTIITLTLCDEADDTQEINLFNTTLDNNAILNAAIGQSITISGAGQEDDAGKVLNGTHEIVGFGTGTGELKIACQAPEDNATYNGEGNENITFESTLLEDDLKSKWIFGMSYLYDGGGDELQESIIRTGNLHGSVNQLYFLEYFNGQNYVETTWYSVATGGASDWANNKQAIDFNSSGGYAEHNEWACDGSNIVHSDSGYDMLFCEQAANTISASTKYKVTVDLNSTFSSSADEAIFYIGIGSDDGLDHTDASVFVEGVNKRTLVGNVAGSGRHSFFITTKSSVTDENTIAIRAKGDFGIDYVVVEGPIVDDGVEMSSTHAVDLRSFSNAFSSQMTFLCNNSRTESAQNNSWNERIEGFRIYMKQVEMFGGELSDEWLLLYDVNLANGTYLCYAKDEDEIKLQLANPSGTSDDWTYNSATDKLALVTTDLRGDLVRTIPLNTYESENGWPASTNLAAMYKTAATVNRKVYIGNLKIGERTYPDRMIKAPADKFDTFPNDGTHYIDVATADGDSIVKLESFGNTLLQFKKRNMYTISVSDEGEELEGTYIGAGVLSPSQVVKTTNGIIWANSNGLYLYDGEKTKSISSERFNANAWDINENKDTPIILGFDESSSKIIINSLNTSGKNQGGYIYDIPTDSISECQGIFNWYLTNENNHEGSNDDPSIESDFNNGNPNINSVLPNDWGNQTAFRTNSVVSNDRKLIIASSNNLDSTNVNFNTWNAQPKNLWKWTKSAEAFNIQTRDIFFDNPSRRKKIYKVYVTFKAGGYYSNVLLKYATNGSNTFNGTFANTTYYSNTYGFDSYNAGSSSSDWITVALKPSNSINNVYSIQLKFEYADAGRSGQKVQSGPGASTIQLDSGASGSNDFYNGMPISIYSGPGAGMNYKITDYVGSTKVATVSPNINLWHFPTSSSYYELGYIPKEFEINDISITYREKPIK